MSTEEIISTRLTQLFTLKATRRMSVTERLSLLISHAAVEKQCMPITRKRYNYVKTNRKIILIGVNPVYL